MSENTERKFTFGHKAGRVAGKFRHEDEINVATDENTNYDVGNKLGKVAKSGVISNKATYNLKPASHQRQEGPGPSVDLQLNEPDSENSRSKKKVGETIVGGVEGTVNNQNKVNLEIDGNSNYCVGDLIDGDIEEGAEVFLGGNYNITCSDYGQPSGDLQVNKVFDGNKGTIKGRVLIFNHEFKNCKPKYRKGSDRDVESLCKTFRKFGIDPSVKVDMNLKDIQHEITMLSNIDFTDHKLFVCVFMSHGESGGIVEANDKKFNLKETIINPILRTRSLNRIPKILITVACRGEGDYQKLDLVENDGCIASKSDNIDYSNHIISYSTYEEHVSKRTIDGTYFIQSLCEEIDADVRNETPIVSIFGKVNGNLTKMFIQAPVFETTMDDRSFGDLMSRY